MDFLCFTWTSSALLPHCVWTILTAGLKRSCNLNLYSKSITSSLFCAVWFLYCSTMCWSRPSIAAGVLVSKLLLRQFFCSVDEVRGNLRVVDTDWFFHESTWPVWVSELASGRDGEHDRGQFVHLLGLSFLSRDGVWFLWNMVTIFWLTCLHEAFVCSKFSSDQESRGRKFCC